MKAKKPEFRSTSNKTATGEQKLWCAMIAYIFTSASFGDATSLLFFTTIGGHFSNLCYLLGLPEDDIRARVISRAKVERARKYDRSNSNGN